MYAEMFEFHADLLKAMAHPRRLEIIQLLREQELSVSDIHTMLDLPQANISQHLMILRNSGIVETRRDGKQVFYKITDAKIIQASDLLREVLIEQNANTTLADELMLNMKELVPIAQDPVCHMRVSPKTASFHIKQNDQHFYFCASGCLKAFSKDPKKYVSIK